MLKLRIITFQAKGNDYLFWLESVAQKTWLNYITSLKKK